MSKFVCFLLVITCLIYKSDNSLIRIDNNGYSGITVGFSRRVESDKKEELIENLKNLLSEASNVLYEITNQRAYFKEITFIIPKGWNELESWISSNGNSTVEKIRFEKYNRADIFVEPEGGIFGNNPYTIQIAGCAKQGLGIYITEKYLQLNNDNLNVKARELVYEWLKYRYGVFDEHGFQGDERYPVLHGIPGNSSFQKVTSCSNKPVSYSGRNCKIDINTGRLTDLACAIDMKLESGAESSFMFSSTLTKLCGGDNVHTHDESSPTKHNTLCFENSVSTVMDGHTDLKEVSVSTDYDVPSTMFRYVMESNLRLVLAIDSSADETGIDVVGKLKKSLYRFLEFAIPHSVLDLVFYDFDSADIQSIKNAYDWRFPTTDRIDRGCIQCALNRSIEVLNKNKPIEGSTLVLVTKDILNDADCDAILRIAAKEKIKIHIIFCFNDDLVINNQEKLNQLKYQFAKTDVRIQYMLMSVDNAEYLLFEALKTSVRDDTFGTADDYIMIVQQSFTSPNFWINFTFPVDKTAERDLSILLSLKNLDKIYDKTLTLSSHDKTYIRNDVTVVDRQGAEMMKIEVPGVKAGNMKLSIKKDYNMPVHVIVFAKESVDSSAIIVRCWLNSATQFIDVNSSSDPIILYTEVRSGNYPVRNARVIASLQHPDKSNITFTIPDDGLGDPDITKDDGIYTRYITEFITEGHYILTISVTNGDKTQIIRGKEKDNLCCGSFVPLGNTIPTEAFSRLYYYGSLFVSLPQNSESKDFYPPSRITDFKIVSVSGKFDNAETPSWRYYLTFSFSAPGGNYGNDKASYYEIKYFPHRSAARDFTHGTIPEEFHYNPRPPSPEEYGKKQIFTFEISKINLKKLAALNDMVFFAIRAVDNSENKGKTSNIVEVYLPLPLPPTENSVAISSTKPSLEGDDGTNPNALSDDQKSLNSQIGIIVGIVVACIILLIATAVVAFIFIRRRKTIERQRKLKDNWEDPASNKPKNVSNEQLPEDSTPIPLNASISPVQSWPANVLMDHYDKIQEGKRKNGLDDSMDSSSGDSSHPLKPNPIYEENADNRYIGNNRYLPSAPFTSSQNSLNQPRHITQV